MISTYCAIPFFPPLPVYNLHHRRSSRSLQILKNAGVLSSDEENNLPGKNLKVLFRINILKMVVFSRKNESSYDFLQIALRLWTLYCTYLYFTYISFSKIIPRFVCNHLSQKLLRAHTHYAVARHTTYWSNL